MLPYLWSIEDILHRQHRYNGKNLFTTTQMYRHDEHFTQHGLQGKLSHLDIE